MWESIQLLISGQTLARILSQPEDPPNGQKTLSQSALVVALKGVKFEFGIKGGMGELSYKIGVCSVTVLVSYFAAFGSHS